MPKYTLFTINGKKCNNAVKTSGCFSWIIFAPDLEVSLEMSQRNEYTEMLKFCFGKLNL